MDPTAHRQGHRDGGMQLSWGGAEGGTAIFVVILTTQMYFYGQ